jgi:DNA-binding transcriptional MocR family regulator
MTLARRAELLAWAAERDVLIIEDDPYGALYFDDVATAAETRPIKADDRDDRVVYLSSFSKTVAPGFRVAWITAAPSLIARFEIAKQSADLCTSAIDQRFVYEIWRQGLLEGRLGLLRRAYQQKRTVLEQALRRELGTYVTWPEPKGGFFLWASFGDGIDTDALLCRAVAHGVVFVPGSAFYVEPGRADRARLSFSEQPPARIEAAVARLASAVREELELRGTSGRAPQAGLAAARKASEAQSPE